MRDLTHDIAAVISNEIVTDLEPEEIAGIAIDSVQQQPVANKAITSLTAKSMIQVTAKKPISLIKPVPAEQRPRSLAVGEEEAEKGKPHQRYVAKRLFDRLQKYVIKKEDWSRYNNVKFLVMVFSFSL